MNRNKGQSRHYRTFGGLEMKILGLISLSWNIGNYRRRLVNDTGWQLITQTQKVRIKQELPALRSFHNSASAVRFMLSMLQISHLCCLAVSSVALLLVHVRSPQSQWISPLLLLRHRIFLAN